MNILVHHVNSQGRRKGNFQRGARSANFQIFFSNMDPNKSISDFGGGAPACQGGAPDHFGMPGGGARPRAPPFSAPLSPEHVI